MITWSNLSWYHTRPFGESGITPNINHALSSQQTPHTSPSRVCWVFLETIDRVITAPHCIYFRISIPTNGTIGSYPSESIGEKSLSLSPVVPIHFEDADDDNTEDDEHVEDGEYEVDHGRHLPETKNIYGSLRWRNSGGRILDVHYRGRAMKTHFHSRRMTLDSWGLYKICGM